MKLLSTVCMAGLLMQAAPALSNEALEEAKAMLERVEEMRADADALEAEAKALLKEAKEAAAAARAESKLAESKQPKTASADSGAETAVDNLAVAYEEDGKFFTNDDVPTYRIKDDGTVDWYTFSGFRRYHAECHVCHGPDGEGSTYAPELKKSAVELDYYDFVDTVVNGRKNGNSVMPSFGDNPNVMCYLDDIYVYLKAHGSEAIGRGRPKKKDRKSETFIEDENSCMG